MEGETVVGIFDRARLSEALVAVHKSGLGTNARVLDGARGDLAGQLRRAGFQTELMVGDLAAETALLLIYAPQRSEPVRQALERAGARSTVVLTGGTPAFHWTPAPRPTSGRTRRSAPAPAAAPVAPATPVAPAWLTDGGDVADQATG